jgi:hypothetical protein
MTVDGKEILARLSAAKKNDKDKVTLYLSRSLYRSFKDVCGELPASVVIEELMKEFLDSTKKVRTGERMKA